MWNMMCHVYGELLVVKSELLYLLNREQECKRGAMVVRYNYSSLLYLEGLATTPVK